jgi:hypothetical protein
VDIFIFCIYKKQLGENPAIFEEFSKYCIITSSRITTNSVTCNFEGHIHDYQWGTLKQLSASQR